MITWMQKHKKYLIVTIWISTIAFVGAGFVGWGQYKYGDKAGTVAKVGKVDISLGELQTSYSNLYAQYNQMFRGQFDEEKAKSFGLKEQALKYLTQQALVLNLAASYDLEVSDAEIFEDIKTKDYFFKNGVFDKETYKEVLLKNNQSVKEYEKGVRKELLIKKTLKLLQVESNENEQNILDTVLSIADKLEYKVLTPQMVNVEVSDEALKPYWEKIKDKFMNEASYDLKYIKLPLLTKEYSKEELEAFYKEIRDSLKDAEGKILEFDNVKERLTKELNAKESKKEALKSYIAYKKGETSGLNIESAHISKSNNPFGLEAYEAVIQLSSASAFSKPVLIGDAYYTFELVKANSPEAKSYEDAKKDVALLFGDEQKRTKLAQIAKESLDSFKGSVTDFITQESANAITGLDKTQTNEFLNILFTTQKKQDIITLRDGTVVLYKIVEQKLLTNTNANKDNSIIGIKSELFSEGLLKNLQNRYKTEILVKGL